MNKNFASRISAACRKGFAPVAVAGAAIASSPAFAAYDITAATAAISDAGTSAGTLLAAAIGFAGMIVGGLLLFRMIKRIG